MYCTVPLPTSVGTVRRLFLRLCMASSTGHTCRAVALSEQRIEVVSSFCIGGLPHPFIASPIHSLWIPHGHLKKNTFNIVCINSVLV
ncbi:hypothetical protein M432DRAFT_606704 [Thermoascus aurantiacus ATCC 26904]